MPARQLRPAHSAAVGGGLLLALLGPLPPALAEPQAEQDFGRWERSVRHCEILLAHPRVAEGAERPAAAATQPAEPLSCRGVRLDQQLAGLLSIRLLPRAQDRGGPPLRLVFAGVLLPGSQPMRCQDSHCEPQWPIRVQLSALATSDAGSLGLPQARVVQGSCSLAQERLLCTARDLEGSQWQAKASW